MIEMQIRAIRRDQGTGRPVVQLEPHAGEAHGPLILALSHAEAHVLAHELRGHHTLRGQAFALLDRALAQLHATVAAVEIVPSGDGKANARLQLDRPGGSVQLPIELGQALGLAVSRQVPLHASEILLPAGDAGASAAVLEGPIEIPDAFQQAFAEWRA